MNWVAPAGPFQMMVLADCKAALYHSSGRDMVNMHHALLRLRRELVDNNHVYWKIQMPAGVHQDFFADNGDFIFHPRLADIKSLRF